MTADPSHTLVPGGAAPGAGFPEGTIGRREALLRTAATILLAGSYYWVSEPLSVWARKWYLQAAGLALDPTTPHVVGAFVLLIALTLVWRKIVLRDPRFHAPLLVTAILVLGDAAFNILETHPVPARLEALTGGAIMEYSPAI